MYEVVWPLGKVRTPRIPSNPGVTDFAHSTVGELWSGLNKGELIFPLLREEFGKRYSGVSFTEIRYPRGGDEKAALARIGRTLLEKGCAAAIAGFGGSPGTTSPAIVAAIEAQKVGVCAVALVETAYVSQAIALSRNAGLSGDMVVEYPGAFAQDDEGVVAGKIRSSVFNEILVQLAKPVSVSAVTSPEPNDIVFKGTLEDVQEFFTRSDWSDGLPVIPPTVDKVARFLRFTNRAPDEVIAVFPEEYREATIWNIAVNGVMAGCGPQYMPVLIAIVEAMADPAFRIEDAGSSPGWEPLVILSGRIAKELDFNSGVGVLRSGRRANTSVGRFVRLFLRNIGGSRIPPGDTDRCAIGTCANVVLAEDERSTREVGWPLFRIDEGFDEDDNVVSVQSILGTGLPVYPGGLSARDDADTLIDAWGGACGYWAFHGMILGGSYPLLIMNKRIAESFARDNWSKPDLKDYLAQKITVRVRSAETWARYTTANSFSIAGAVSEGRLPSAYHESPDPERLVPAFMDARSIGIVVAGDPNRNQVRGLISSATQGARVSKKIETSRLAQNPLG